MPAWRIRRDFAFRFKLNHGDATQNEWVRTGTLRNLIRRSERLANLSGPRRSTAAHLGEYLVRRAIGGDLPQHAPPAVVIQQAAASDRWYWRNRSRMVSGSSSGRPREQQAIDQLRLRDIERQHQIERHPTFGQHSGRATSACGTVRGKPSNRQPRSAVLFCKAIDERCRQRCHPARVCRRSCTGPLPGRAACRPRRLRAAFRRSRDERHSGSPSAVGLASLFQQPGGPRNTMRMGAVRGRNSGVSDVAFAIADSAGHEIAAQWPYARRFRL